MLQFQNKKIIFRLKTSFYLIIKNKFFYEMNS